MLAVMQVKMRNARTVFVMGATFALAAVAHVAIERPFLRWKAGLEGGTRARSTIPAAPTARTTTPA